MAELGFELRKMRKLIDYFLAEAIFFFFRSGGGSIQFSALRRYSCKKGLPVGFAQQASPASDRR